MLFKDRSTAGEKLARKIIEEGFAKNSNKNIVLSLIRGGAPVGERIAAKLKSPHYPFIIKKISSPHNPELAIGAMGEESYYLNRDTIKMLLLSQTQIKKQINKTKNKILTLKKVYPTKKIELKEKHVFLVDDGIATGSTAYAALKLLKRQKAKKIILAVPVAPKDFEGKGFNDLVILDKPVDFSAVSQFYEYFPQLSNEQVKEYFN